MCVVVAHGTPCLGPVTHAGCCFGPMETPNAGAQVGLLRPTGMAEARRPAGLPNFNAGSPAFVELSQVTTGPPPGLGPRDLTGG